MSHLSIDTTSRVIYTHWPKKTLVASQLGGQISRFYSLPLQSVKISHDLQILEASLTYSL